MIDKSAILKKAQLYTAKGQIEKAIEEWQKLIQETPNDGNIYNTIGDLYLKKNEINSAIAAYLKAGDVFNEAGFSLKTIAVYKKILKIEPENVDVHLKLGDLNAERGLIGNARDNYLVAAKDYTKKGLTKKALEIYRKIADLDSSNTVIRVKIAELYLKEGMNKEALEEFIKAAEAYIEKGEVREAEEIYKHIIKSDPKNSNILINLGGLYLRDNRILEAIEILQKAVKDNSEDINLLKTLAEACDKGGKYEEEERVFRRLIELEPQNHQHHKGLGYCLLRIGSNGEAFKAFELASKEYFKCNDFQNIVQMMNDLLAIDPNNNKAKGLLAETYEKSGSGKEAITLYLSIADACVQQNQLDKAISTYEKILTLDPENSTAKNGLGRLKEGGSKELKEDLEALASSIASIAEPDAQAATKAETCLPLSVQQAGTRQEEVAEAPLPAVQEDLSEKKELIENSFTEADVYLKYGLINKAIEQLETALSIDPNNIQAHTRLKDIYKISGENQKAISKCLILSKLYKDRGDNEKREAITAEALDIEPENEKVKREWMEITGEMEAVTVVAEDVASSQTIEVTEEPLATVELSDEEAIAEAEFYLQQGLVEEARRIYRRILTMNPGNREIEKRLLELMDEEGAPLSGVGEEKVVAPPESPKVIEEEPISAIPETPVPAVPEKEKKPEEYFDLTKELSKILEEESSPEEKGAAESFETLSLDSIFKEFQKGVKEQFGDEDYETHYNLGIAYKEMGLINEAIEEFQLSVKGNGRFFDSASMLAFCFREKGMHREAIEQLEKALQDPRFTEKDYIGLKYDLGQLYEDIGDIGRALTIFTEVQKVDADFRDIAKKVSDLKKKAKEPIIVEENEEEIEIKMEVEEDHEEKPRRTAKKKGKGRVSYL